MNYPLCGSARGPFSSESISRSTAVSLHLSAAGISNAMKEGVRRSSYA